MKPTVFEYRNYRLFLRDYYLSQKASEKGFTYARFSSSTRIKSPNFLKLVIDGKKNLTAENASRFARALRLTKSETEYFETLILQNQAKELKQRRLCEDRLNLLALEWKKAVSTEEARGIRELGGDEFDMISNWLHHAVLIATNVKDFKESPRWLRERLFHLASESDIAEVLQCLKDLGLLTRDANKRLRQSHRQIQTKPELQRLAARCFYEGLMSRAAQSMSLTGPEEREFSAYIVGLSPHLIPELREKVRAFMKSLNEWALSHSDPEQVYAFQFGAFPLTAKPVLKSKRTSEL